jgi:hypothetical protein
VVRAGFEEALQLLFGDELCSGDLADELVEALIGGPPTLPLGTGLEDAKADGAAEGGFGPGKARFGPGKGRFGPGKALFGAGKALFGTVCHGGSFRQDVADVVKADFKSLEAFFSCHSVQPLPVRITTFSLARSGRRPQADTPTRLL